MSNTLLAPKARDILFHKQCNQDSIGDLSKAIVDINSDDRFLEKLYAAHDLDYKPKPIRIHIDSFGGSVYQTFGLLSLIENSVTPVHTIVTGCAMSCGFLITIMGHKRFCYPNSTLLYHQVSSGVWGKLADLQEEITEIERLQNKIEQMTLERTKITEAMLKKVFKRKIDWHMDANEALKLGVVDEIL